MGHVEKSALFKKGGENAEIVSKFLQKLQIMSLKSELLRTFFWRDDICIIAYVQNSLNFFYLSLVSFAFWAAKNAESALMSFLAPFLSLFILCNSLLISCLSLDPGFFSCRALFEKGSKLQKKNTKVSPHNSYITLRASNFE